MPRSKRDRRVTLAKAGKHVLTRDVKSRIVDEIRGAVDRYGNAYVLEIENSRNELLNNARSVFKDSKFYFGRNQICKVALGVDTSSEYADGISEIGKHLSGQTCLLFTDRDFEVLQLRTVQSLNTESRFNRDLTVLLLLYRRLKATCRVVRPLLSPVLALFQVRRLLLRRYELEYEECSHLSENISFGGELTLSVSYPCAKGKARGV
mmetsp:Transcript_18893/g.75891  ORF Transcript_18893/g.75891 Transcript_18893/m.75891 type:complete len:207 (-) Transcript_18893:394-1014(-)